MVINLLKWTVVFITSNFLIGIIFKYVMSKLQRSYFRNQQPQSRRYLLVIAHPDDEAMFFGPTIQHLIKLGKDVFVLCLSEGNFYGDGTRRVVELRQSLLVSV